MWKRKLQNFKDIFSFGEKTNAKPKKPAEPGTGKDTLSLMPDDTLNRHSAPQSRP